MSNLTELLKGKLTLAAFVEKSANDIKKDLRFLSFIPGLKDWVFNALELALISKGVSPTVADMIVDKIRDIVDTDERPLSPQPSTPPT